MATGLAPLWVLLAVLTGRVESRAPVSICSQRTTVVTYTSSIDSAVLETLELLPSGYSAEAPYPLVVLLPGVGGTLCNYSSALWETAADNHGMVLMTVRPRLLPGYGTARSTFYLDGALAPGEQDILDAVAAMRARRDIDPARIYLAGYSMGGVGTLGLASRHPGMFAAAAPGAVISDLYQEAAYTSTQPNPGFPILLGGPPGQDAATDTRWHQNSPRFLLVNLMHTPLFVVHGLSDTLIPNNTATWPYMQARHIVDTPGYSDGRGEAETLQELGTAWPGSYLETHLWPSADHGAAQASWTPEAVLSFFDGRVAITQPLTAALTTFDDQLTRAYWLGVDLTTPWSAIPATAFAVRRPLLNSAHALVTGSLTLTLDLPGMALTNLVPLTISLGPLGGSPAGDVAVVVSGSWTAPGGYEVTRDGSVLTTMAFQVAPEALTLLRQANTATRTYVIAPQRLVLPLEVHLPLISR